MASPLDPLASWNALDDAWRRSARMQEAWWTGKAPRSAILRLREQRLAGLLRHAADHCAIYRRRRSGAEGAPIDLLQFAPVTKRELMSDFDGWVADPTLKLADIERFIADPARIGQRYQGRYTIWTSSGSTGHPGIYVQDEGALAVYDALLVTRFPRSCGIGSPFRTLFGGGRFAMVAALGGHFAGVVSWERLRRESPWMAATTRAFSVLAPLPELVAQLNDYSPAVLASYPTTLLLLARERAAGRLRISPSMLWSGGETLAPAERAEMAGAFGAHVIDGYGASECMQIAFDCGHGSLHLNSDWVILEPVDERGRPVPDGERSATSLLTNLANRVQPLVRYDIGDSVTYRTGPCACGSPFPALEVDGRRDDIVVLETASGESVSLPPLAIATVVEDDGGAGRFQVVQTGPRALKVRFETPAGTGRAAAWARIASSLRAYLSRHGLEGIAIREDRSPPRADPVSGKLREVLGLRSTGAASTRRADRKEHEDDAQRH